MAGSQDRWISPLRYPGGKARMAAFLGEVFDRQIGPMDIEIWMEPFAGGAGAGLTLLDQHLVEEVWLVEKNPALAAFWRAVVEQGPKFANHVEHLTPNMALWQASTDLLHAAADGNQLDDLQLGLAAFVVNRCSRSGIVNHRTGPIGGKQQDGRWTVASRFNATELAERIRHIHSLRSIQVFEEDAISHIAELNDSGIGDELFLFVDPPYIREGNRLYANGMSAADHQRLADALNNCWTPWMLTYDDEPAVAEDLYPDCRVLAYQIPNTANRQRIAWEYAVFSDNLRIPDDPVLLARGDTRWVRSEADLRRTAAA